MNSTATYSVSYMRGCRVVNGQVPICDIVALMQAWADYGHDATDEWYVDSLLSQYLNVNMVCGPRSATTAWRAELGLTPAPEDQQRK